MSKSVSPSLVATLATVALLSAVTCLSGQDRALDWRFEERLRLGDALGSEAEAFHDLTLHSVLATADGRLYIVDRGNHRVQVFDSTGAHVRTIGHEGAGPGEFRNPVSIWSGSDGSVSVFDWAYHRVSRFTAAGDLIDDRTVSFGRGMLMYGDSERELYTITEGLRTDSLGVSPESTVERLVHIEAGDTTALGRLALVPPRMIHYEKPCRFGIGITPLFEPDIAWDFRDRRVAVNDGYEYRIRVFDDGGSAFEVTRPIEPLPLTADAILEELGESLYMPNPYGGDCGRLGAEVILEARGFYPFRQIIQRIEIAPGSGLWVRRAAGASVGDTTSVTDVFDADGAYLGTLPLDAPFPIAFTPGGDVITIERDEFDVQQVVVYAIRQKVP